MMKLIKLFASLYIMLMIVSCSAEKQDDMNGNWLFLLEDQPAAKAPDFDDSDWRSIDLPHDWAFENGYSQTGTQGDRGGYASGGIGWYRKYFHLTSTELADSRFFLNFDAAYMNSEVWINGHYLGKRPYGYISFSYELTEWLETGKNVVAVRVDNSMEPSARWYHGCGIYGNVCLKRTADIRFAENSIYISTPSISEDGAEVHFTGKIDARNLENRDDLCLSWTIFSPDGDVAATAEGITISQLENGIDVHLSHPQIWDVTSPQLYYLSLNLYRSGERIATEKTRFGIRSLAWQPETGFQLNGRSLKLQGVCEHLEGGPVGAAWTKDLMRWKLQLLKKMGCNAIRTAHNPQLPFFYDLCDEIGLLVMDECFDGWGMKAQYDYGMQAFDECWEQDLRTFIRRDRNHPSVILWSVGNETRGKVAADLVKVCHEEDPSRLVTSGHSGSEFMDVFGVNGNSEKKSFVENYRPQDKAFVGTETPHTWQVRGYYRSKTWYRDGFPNKKQDPYVIPDLTEKEIFNYEWAPAKDWTSVKQHFNSSYDNATVRLTARHNIELLRDLPWYSGSFRWTGFDYLGEAGYVHGGWPFRAFMGGALDMAGFKKDLYYLYQAEWSSEPMVHLLPHWTHPYMAKGTLVPVMAYTNAEEVELLLDGHSLGRQQKGRSWDKMACTWMVPWEEGKLEAIAYSDGKEVARTIQRTSAHPSEIGVGVQDITYSSKADRTFILTLSEQDKEGTLYPYGENRIYFNTGNEVKVLSLENGNPVDVETNWNARSKTAFFGLLRAFVSVPMKESPAPVYVGAILGDKKLKLSNEITIEVRKVDLITGQVGPSKVEIHYTLDGTTPDNHSPLYEKGFSIEPETTVKAVVYKGKEKLFEMEERFGPDEGLSWNTGQEETFTLRGQQAEMLDWTGFRKSSQFEGFEGECYLEQIGEKARLSFYQENDGSQKVASLRLHYLHQTGHPVIEVWDNHEKVLVRTLEKEPSGKWETLELQVPLCSGANQIDIHFKEAAGNCADWIELAE